MSETLEQTMAKLMIQFDSIENAISNINNNLRRETTILSVRIEQTKETGKALAKELAETVRKVNDVRIL